LQGGLIQRLIITRVPVLIGTGIPLFGAVPRDIVLKHVATRHYASGLVQSEYMVAGFCLYGCFSRPQLLVLGGGAAAVSKNPARVPVEVRHRRGLPTVSSRLPLAGRLRLPALCPPAGV